MLDDAIMNLLNFIAEDIESLESRISRNTKEEQAQILHAKAEKERQVMKTLMSKRLDCGTGGDFLNDPDFLGKEAGEEFLSNEVGLNRSELCEEGKRCAALVGYHRLALMMIGNMIKPINKASKEWCWLDVIDYIEAIRSETKR